MSTQIHFEEYDPRDEKGTDVRQSLAHLDYSPLPRVTWRSFSMGVLISMGGLIFGYDTGQISGFLGRFTPNSGWLAMSVLRRVSLTMAGRLPPCIPV